jgi:hypothetical protein
MLRDVKGCSNSLSPHKQGHCDKVVPCCAPNFGDPKANSRENQRIGQSLNGLNPGPRSNDLDRLRRAAIHSDRR